MELSIRTRRAISTILAVVLAVETVSAVAAAAATRTATRVLPADPPAGAVLAAEAAPAQVRDVPPVPAHQVVVRVTASSGATGGPVREAPVGASVRQGLPGPTRAAPVDPARNGATRRDEAGRDRAATSARRGGDGSKTAASDRQGSRDTSPAFAGRNRVWIPSLGIRRSVSWFPCDRQRPPDNYLYRWGCAGTNNVYLMGHAYSVMKPLHDAYVRGTLRKGMKAWYADANGRVTTYAVKWWRITLPTPDAAWAWAPQDVPSMTLQTCVGRDSKYRLMVRLVRVRD